MGVGTARAVLGVGESADEQRLRTARRARARQVHPDRGAGVAAGDGPMQRVNEAYEVLLVELRTRPGRATDPVVCLVCEAEQEVARADPGPTCRACRSPLLRLVCTGCGTVRLGWAADAWACGCGGTGDREVRLAG